MEEEQHYHHIMQRPEIVFFAERSVKQNMWKFYWNLFVGYEMATMKNINIDWTIACWNVMFDINVEY
jgi:hypothetical protein